MKGIKVNYLVDGHKMTDEEFENQTDKVFHIDEEDIKEFIDSKIPMKEGEWIDWANSEFDSY